MRNNKYLMFFCLIFCYVTILCWSVEAEPVNITIYHTSDFHDTSVNIARIARFVQYKKKLDPNTIFLDTGDWFNKGDLALLESRGGAMANLLGQCNYDALVFGNHEYSFGTQRLFDLVKEHSLPILAYNIEFTSNIKKPANIKPYKIIDLVGVKVAIIGSACPYTNHQTDTLMKVNPIEQLLDVYINILDQESDIIVLMTHIGEPKDILLAKAFPRIDLILGGHDHRIYNEMMFLEDSKTIIHHSGQRGQCVGEIKLTWNDDHITDRHTRIINITPDMAQSAKVKSIVDGYLLKLPQIQPAN